MLNTIVGIIGVGLMTIFGWAVNINSRVSVQDQSNEDLFVLVNSKFDEVSRRLERIENTLNGSLYRH